MRPFLRSAAMVILLVAVIRLTGELPRFFALWQTEAPLQWWASRATGFVAYFALWLSMIMGMMISSRGLDGWLNRKTVLAFHQQWTLAAVIATLAHIAVIVGDPYVEMDWGGALIPGQSAYLPGAVALGALAFWGMIVLTVSSWLQRRMRYVVWRVIHTSALGAFVLALTHGVVAGTDSAWVAAQATYAGTAAVLLGALVFRALYMPQKARPRAAVVAGPPPDAGDTAQRQGSS